MAMQMHSFDVFIGVEDLEECCTGDKLRHKMHMICNGWQCVQCTEGVVNHVFDNLDD